MPSQVHVPEAMDGTVIARSVGKTIGWIIVGICMVPFGAVLIFARIKGELTQPDEGGTRITLYGLILGVCCVLVAPLVVYHQLRSLWVRRRLVIANDRLQIQESKNGVPVVKLQIPFANVTHVGCELVGDQRQLVIDLINPDDPETYRADEDDDFKWHKEHFAHHFHTFESFKGTLESISNEIQRAMKAWALNKLGSQQDMDQKLGTTSPKAGVADTGVRHLGPSGQ